MKYAILKYLLTIFFAGLFCQDTSLVNNLSILEVDSIYNSSKNYFSDEEILFYLDKLAGNYHHSNVHKALKYAYQGLELSVRLNNKKYEASFESNIAYALAQNGLINQSLKHYEKAFEINEAIGLGPQSAWRLISIGNLYFQQNLHDLANEKYKKSYNIFEKLQDVYGMAVAENNQGMVYGESKNYQEELESYIKAYELRKSLSYPKIIAHSLNLIGNALINLGKIHDGIDSLKKSLSIYKEINETEHLVGECYISLGNAWNKIGQKDSTLHYFDKANQFFIKNRLNKHIPIVHLAKATLFYEFGEYSKSLKHIELGLLEARQLNLKFDIKSLLVLKREIATSRNDLPMIVEISKEYIALNESIFNSSVTQAITQGELKRNQELNDKNIQIQKLNINKLKQDKFVLILIITIIILLLFGFISRFRYIRRTNQKILEKQNEIHLQKSKMMEVEKNAIEKDLDHKKRVLVSKAMNIAQNHEFLIEIMSKLNTIRKKSPKIKKIINQLENKEHVADEWKEFDAVFSDVHIEFYTLLSEQFPSLTQRDLKICAMLRLNLNTKEIASLTNLTVRTIGEYRTKIRKKLSLTRDINLYSYFQNI